MSSEHLGSFGFDVVNSLVAKSYYDELGKTNLILEGTMRKQIADLGGPEKALEVIKTTFGVESQLFVLAETWFFEEAD